MKKRKILSSYEAFKYDFEKIDKKLPLAELSLKLFTTLKILILIGCQFPENKHNDKQGKATTNAWAFNKWKGKISQGICNSTFSNEKKN